MKSVTVHRATGQIDPCTIIIGESVEEVSKSPTDGTPLSLNTMASVLNYEADAIADALCDHLPQAVAQRVLHRMMLRYATSYLGGIRR